MLGLAEGIEAIGTIVLAIVASVAMAIILL